MTEQQLLADEAQILGGPIEIKPEVTQEVHEQPVSNPVKMDDFYPEGAPKPQQTETPKAKGRGVGTIKGDDAFLISLLSTDKWQKSSDLRNECEKRTGVKPANATQKFLALAAKYPEQVETMQERGANYFRLRKQA